MKDAISEIFSALADDTRRGVYEELLSHVGGLTATELSESASVSRQAIVKHLQILERSGLAEPTRAGREVRYIAQVQGADRASQWLRDHATAWDRRIGELERRASSRRPN
jgi:DNA-binding transcriptional ArsR family regulator